MLIRTEFSFGTCFGPVGEVVARLPAWGGAITDPGAWGHVPFAKACTAAGKRAVLGSRFSGPDGEVAIVIPRSPAGLRALYEAIAAGGTLSAERAAGVGPEWFIVVQGPTSLPPSLCYGCFTPGVNRPAPGQAVASSDNLYPAPGDAQAWALMLGRKARQHTGSRHILTPAELRMEGASAEQLARLQALVTECDTPLPKAENIRFPVQDAPAELAQLCWAELTRRALPAAYHERLAYELGLITEKGFADYFLVIWDLIRYAKQDLRMLVGPARGSSAGSLVCWLLRITEIDPLKFGLIFERFIDINRFDLPDIDIDFPDQKRDQIIDYLRDKYGEHNVAHVGNVLRYKAKSALTDVAKNASVPLFELDQLKDVLIERSSGDSRAGKCLADSMAELSIGRTLLAKYPVLRVAERLEEHAKTSGVHASGLIVCNLPVSAFCGVTPAGRDTVAQVDKKMAADLNVLKIDALGLRTLTIIEECCALANLDPSTMYEVPLDDQATFDLLNAGRFSGVFQYEGIALQSVAKQIKIDCFDDVAAITALARPGPLSGGETTRWIQAKQTGRIEYLHPALEPYCRETLGTIMYQESVMRITRELGGFSWADTAKIRKLMSDRKGNEAFGKFEENFLKGAKERGMAQGDAARIWKAINTFGSWCLSGKTKVRIASVGNRRPLWMTMEELYRKYVLRPSRWNAWHPGKLPKVWSLKGTRAFPERPIRIRQNGWRECLWLEFDDGTKIECTKDHKFIINGAWRPCGEARCGDLFTAVEVEKKGYISQRGYAGRRGRAMQRFRKRMAGRPCQDCARLRKMDVHHNDFADGKLRAHDLAWLCRACHKRRHWVRAQLHKHKGLVGVQRTLVRINREHHKRVMTYDIEMPAPHHNFAIDGGIITHNSFNKSHAVAYGLVSYWTAWLKAHHPLPFLVASLRHEKGVSMSSGGEKLGGHGGNEEFKASIAGSMAQLLREALALGVKYTPVDPARSTLQWELAENELLGPLTGIPGIGLATAQDILERRRKRVALTPRQQKLLTQPSVYTDPSPAHSLFGDLYAHPEKYFRTVTKLHEIADIDVGEPYRQFAVLGRLIKKNLRDLNEEKYRVRRNGRLVADDMRNMLLFHLEDDTGRVLCKIDARRYERLGAPIVEKAALGQWLAVKGRFPTDFKMLEVENVKWLSPA